MSEITGPNESLSPVPPVAEPRFLPPPTTFAPPSFEAPNLRPIPFEDLEAFPSFWSRVGGMFRLVFSNPMELFDRVPVTEGLGAPWRFLLLLSVPMFLFFALVLFLLGSIATIALLEQTNRSDLRALVSYLPLIFGGFLVLMPLFSFLGMIITGALNHFFLWMWGGLKPGMGLNQTIRLKGYISAYTVAIMLPFQVLGMIPVFGIVFSLVSIPLSIGLMVVEGMGLARMHKTDTWRGICAVLTPLFLLCCCGLAAVLAIPAIIAATR